MNIEVARDELARVRIDDSDEPAIAEGQALLRIEAFGLSTNNITYAVFGDILRYWEFFPATQPGEGDESWGRIPVWGFARVLETQSPHVEVGERLFGYYPMSSSLVITPGRADARGVSDIAPHRAEMAGAYSRYVRSAADPIHRAERADQQMLLYPLFFTAFLIDDFLVDNESFGAEQIVVSSASSKTAIGVAHLVHERGGHAVGLTSSANRAFVEGLGVYDQVLTYDEVDQIEVQPSVYVDITGNQDVLHAVHTHLSGGMLTHSMIVGGTHWDHQTETGATELPAPAPEFFFAPTQGAKRTKEWGSDELDRRLGSAWTHFVDWTDGWLELHHAFGTDAVTAVYHELLAGHPDPRAGYICSLAQPDGAAGPAGPATSERTADG